MAASAYPHGTITGLILAGGRSSRMGGNDKAGLMLEGQTLVARACRQLMAQCGCLLISANNALMRVIPDIPVIADGDDQFSGPIAGILAAMEWSVVNKPGTEWLLTSAVDCPFLPHDLGQCLWQSLETGKFLALAQSGGRTHFVCGLWHISLRATLRELLAVRKIRRAETIADHG
ncbi:MAG: NTP transferase domain-containing protein [Beijerinckiaceae bacterium]|nr:NTP transferase domain-containing protein [Beijerinckiaceae bacterium]